jgi:hypothetical protein
LSELQRLTLVHELDESGDHYRFAASKSKPADAALVEGEQPGKAKAQEAERKSKGNGNGNGSWKAGVSTPKEAETSDKKTVGLDSSQREGGGHTRVI